MSTRHSIRPTPIMEIHSQPRSLSFLAYDHGAAMNMRMGCSRTTCWNAVPGNLESKSDGRQTNGFN